MSLEIIITFEVFGLFLVFKFTYLHTRLNVSTISLNNGKIFLARNWKLLNLIYLVTIFMPKNQLPCHMYEVRVTRLGKFSPLGRLFTLGILLKSKEVDQIFVLLFFDGKSYVLILAKTGWAIFG
jgi:hypothetical protein